MVACAGAGWGGQGVFMAKKEDQGVLTRESVTSKGRMRLRRGGWSTRESSSRLLILKGFAHRDRREISIRTWAYAEGVCFAH